MAEFAIPLNQKGADNGVAELDQDGKVPEAQSQVTQADLDTGGTAVVELDIRLDAVEGAVPGKASQGALDTEVLARTNADTALTTAVAGKAAQSALDAEITARGSAVDALTTTVAGKLAKSSDPADAGKAADARGGAPLSVVSTAALAGGTTGQALKKTSNADGAYAWGDASGGGPGQITDANDPTATRFTSFPSVRTSGGGAVEINIADPAVSYWDVRQRGNGYLFHIAHQTDNNGKAIASVGTNALFGIGVQGDGGSGILIAKDGLKGIGLLIDQKGVVTDPAAVALRVDVASRFAPGAYFQKTRPGSAPVERVLSVGHTPFAGDQLTFWTSSAIKSSNIAQVDADSGSFRFMREAVVDSLWNTSNNDDARLGYIGGNGRIYIEDRHGMGQLGSTSGDGALIRMHAGAGGSTKQQYSGALRISKSGQSFRIQMHNGAIGLGYENVQTVFDATAVRVAIPGAGFQVLPLATPAAPTMATVGAAGSTTYSYRVAALNANGTTLASAAATIATGNATLDSTNFVRVTRPEVVGATSYRIYGRTAGSELLMATLTSPTRTVADGIMKAAQSPGRTVTDAATTAQSQTITSATAAFTSDDIGSTIVIPDAGFNSNSLDTYITAVTNATTATVATSASRTVSAASLTISRGASRLLTSATAVFARGDVGRRVTVAGAAAAGGVLYTNILNFMSATQVLVEDVPLTSVTAATITIDGGPIPTTFDDTGTVTPSGAIPSAPVGTKSVFQAWESQTGNLLETRRHGGVNANGLTVTAPTATKRANVVVRDVDLGSLALGDTDGFLYMPVIATGTPSGVPTAYGGAVPFCFDVTANKLWVYNGSAWKSTTLA